MRILLVEDEREILNELYSFLQEQGHVCDKAPDYHEAEDRIMLYTYDIMILDITLPGGNGLSLLKLIKQKEPATGVIILSAKDSLTDKLTGLDLGADDYLTKPFYVEELNSRIKAYQRRTSFSGDHMLTSGGLVVDTKAKTVLANGKIINLTRKEYELLLYFMINKKRVLSKESIGGHLWGDQYDSIGNTDIIYTHTMNLRKKIAHGAGVELIETIYGMGYKWTGE